MGLTLLAERVNNHGTAFAEELSDDYSRTKDHSRTPKIAMTLGYYKMICYPRNIHHPAEFVEKAQAGAQMKAPNTPRSLGHNFVANRNNIPYAS